MSVHLMNTDGLIPEGNKQTKIKTKFKKKKTLQTEENLNVVHISHSLVNLFPNVLHYFCTSSLSA